MENRFAITIYATPEQSQRTKEKVLTTVSSFRIYWELLFTFDLLTGDSANAVPHTKKLRTRVAHIWGNRRLQPNRSAMERPRPGETAFLITVLPVPGKYAWISDICPFE